MTSDARPPFLTRVLDLVFGKAVSSEERETLEASLPPETVINGYRVLQPISVAAVLTTFLWTYGWLPLVDSRIDRNWFWLAFGVNVLLRFGWEQVTGYYTRRARAGETLKAASPE